MDNLLASLHITWQAMHQHAKLHTELASSTDSLPCNSDLSQGTHMSNMQQQQQQHQQMPQLQAVSQDIQQQYWSHATDHASNPVYQSQLTQGSQADAAYPQTSIASEPNSVSWRVLGGQEGFLLGLQRLWQHFMHDTQVVSAFLATHAVPFCEYPAQLSCCLSPLHLDCIHAAVQFCCCNGRFNSVQTPCHGANKFLVSCFDEQAYVRQGICIDRQQHQMDIHCVSCAYRCSSSLTAKLNK